MMHPCVALLYIQFIIHHADGYIQEYEKSFCFGEILLRISPSLHGEGIIHTSVNVYIGGAKLHIATTLTNGKCLFNIDSPKT